VLTNVSVIEICQYWTIDFEGINDICCLYVFASTTLGRRN
jgi:hypothetical protein